MLKVHGVKQFDYFTRVYYEDTDSAGVVYHSNYLNFMERARSEWLLWLGYDQRAMDEQNAFFTVVSAKVNFVYPARLYEELKVENKLTKMTYVAIEFEQTVKSATKNDLTFCRGDVKLACVDRRIKPRAIPELLKRRIRNDD